MYEIKCPLVVIKGTPAGGRDRKECRNSMTNVPSKSNLFGNQNTLLVMFGSDPLKSTYSLEQFNVVHECVLLSHSARSSQMQDLSLSLFQS